jgi:hypothetical protein
MTLNITTFSILVLYSGTQNNIKPNGIGCNGHLTTVINTNIVMLSVFRPNVVLKTNILLLKLDTKGNGLK